MKRNIVILALVLFFAGGLLAQSADKSDRNCTQTEQKAACDQAKEQPCHAEKADKAKDANCCQEKAQAQKDPNCCTKESAEKPQPCCEASHS